MDEIGITFYKCVKIIKMCQSGANIMKLDGTNKQIFLKHMNVKKNNVWNTSK